MLKKYLIEKWEIKKAGDVAFSPVLDSAYVNGVNDKSVIQLTVDNDAEVKVMLKPFMHVKLSKTSDAGSGTIEVYENILDITTVGGGQPDEKDVLLSSSTANSVSIKVDELDPKDKVIAIKHTNASDVEQDTTDLFDAGGFLKTSPFTRTFSTGDVFEVVIARMQEFAITVTKEEAGDSHTSTPHKLTIKQSQDDVGNAHHVLLPKGGIEITQSMTDANKRKIYFTKGTKLDYHMTGLPENNSVTEWKYKKEGEANEDVFMGAKFHENFSDATQRVGKEKIEKVEYTPDSNYTPIKLKAELGLVYKVKIVLQDYKDLSKETIDDTFSSDFASVQFRANTGIDGIALNIGYANSPSRRRVRKGTKFQIQTHNQVGDYYFAEYHTDDPSLNLGDNKYKPDFPEYTVNKNITVYIRYTKNLLVKLEKPKPETVNNMNFSNLLVSGSGSWTQSAKKSSVSVKCDTLGSELVLGWIAGKDEFKMSDIPISSIVEGSTQARISLSSSDDQVLDISALSAVMFETRFKNDTSYSPTSALKLAAVAGSPWKARINLKQSPILYIRVKKAK